MSKIKNKLQNIVVVTSSNKEEFENEVNFYLSQGYSIESANANMVNDIQYDYSDYYQAILLSPNVTIANIINDHEERLKRLEKMHFTNM